MKRLYSLVLLVAIAGVGITAYWASAFGTIKVFEDEMIISPSIYSIEMNASSIYTKNITVSTSNSEVIEIKIKVLPADYSTAKAWGTDFIAFAEPSEVEVSSSANAKVTIIHFSERAGNFKVRVIAAK
jgi:hypothetical protein